MDSKDFNVGILERKIRDLEEENKKLQSEAAELANEAYECEVKEEKLVTDAVKHLTEANVQINYLSEEFNVKETESQKQKEEITHLLAQVKILSIPELFKRENEKKKSRQTGPLQGATAKLHPLQGADHIIKMH